MRIRSARTSLEDARATEADMMGNSFAHLHTTPTPPRRTTLFGNKLDGVIKVVMEP